MPTVNLGFDGFRESAHKEFTESPHHDRDTESYTPWTYSRTGGPTFLATHGRSSVGYPAGATSRLYHGETFLRIRYVLSWNNDPVLGGATTGTKTFVRFYRTNGDYHPDTGATSGAATGISDPYFSVSFYGYTTTVSSVLTTDTSSEIRRLDTFSNGTDTVTIEQIYDEPYTYSDMLADLIAIHTAKYAAWESGSSNEQWMYNSAGSIVAGVASVNPVGSVGAPSAHGFYWSEDLAYLTFYGIVSQMASIGAQKFKAVSSPTLATLRFKFLNTKVDLGSPSTAPGTTSIVAVTPVADNTYIVVGPDGFSAFNETTQTSIKRATSEPP